MRRLLLCLVIFALVAVFAGGCAAEYDVIIEADPQNAGEVTGDGVYEQGELVTLKAEPEEGYEFRRWVEEDQIVSQDGEYEFEIDEDRQLTAVFELKEYEVTVEAAPSRGGSISGGGTFQHGETVTVQAESEEGFTFEKWVRNAEKVSSNDTYELEATEDKHLKAVFKKTISEVLKKAMAGEDIDQGEIIKELWEYDLSIMSPIDDKDAEQISERFDSSGNVSVDVADFDLSFRADCFFGMPYLSQELGVEPEEVGFGYEHIEVIDDEYLDDRIVVGPSCHGSNPRYQFRDVPDGSTIRVEISSVLKEMLGFETDQLRIYVEK